MTAPYILSPNDVTEFSSVDDVTKPATSYVFDPAGLRPMKLGYLDEICNRRFSCNLCKLVYEGTHGHGIGHDGLDKDGARVSCSMDWKLDGGMLGLARRTEALHRLNQRTLTRRMRLYNMNASLSEFYIIPALDHTDKPISPRLLGRRLIEEEQADPSRPQEWLQTCEEHHGSMCQSPYHQLQPFEPDFLCFCH